MPPRYRKMTWKERIFGREPDTAEVVVYKNMTLAEWLFGKSDDRSIRLLTCFQRIIGVAGLFVILWALWRAFLCQ